MRDGEGIVGEGESMLSEGVLRDEAVEEAAGEGDAGKGGKGEERQEVVVDLGWEVEEGRRLRSLRGCRRHA